ncbi:uncharacterized protein BDZ99DRAFT_481051 [Mytilinidion resinicola]|uniref:Uncharacterized protein n=1 Tax=Mytilinidion resinicola TaxID=574789 RepID=A0A6A6Y6X7_9PEZI|nr:uncharacterized protein BDZ99DRAFT_481051 [Mytilinidion resinicola]KAF2804576.1 hypothetical protein BDZ99DRAFT_481051 [Mytilinidion resinicola]
MKYGRGAPECKAIAMCWRTARQGACLAAQGPMHASLVPRMVWSTTSIVCQAHQLPPGPELHENLGAGFTQGHSCPQARRHATMFPVLWHCCQSRTVHVSARHIGGPFWSLLVTGLLTRTVTTVTGSQWNTIPTTTRTTTTQTVTETAFSTIFPARKRERNALRAEAKAELDSTVSAVVAGTPAPSPTNSQMSSMDTALSTACTCLNVAPTATETSIYTAPTFTTTLYAYDREVVTSKFTKTETVTTTSTVSALTPATSLTGFSSFSNTSAPATSFVSTDNATIPSSTPLSVTTLYSTSSGLASSVVSSSTSVLPTATAISFSCPEDDNKKIANFIGGKMLEYLLMCNTELIGATPFITLTTSNQDDCAAECSYVDANFPG